MKNNNNTRIKKIVEKNKMKNIKQRINKRLLESRGSARWSTSDQSGIINICFGFFPNLKTSLSTLEIIVITKRSMNGKISAIKFIFIN